MFKVAKRIRGKASRVVGGLGLLLIGNLAFADDVNLSKALPDSILGQWFMDAAGLVIGAVVAVKGIQLIIRLLKRGL